MHNASLHFIHYNFLYTEVKLSLMTAHCDCTWIAESQLTEQVEHSRLSAQMHCYANHPKQFFSFKVNRKSSCYVSLLTPIYATAKGEIHASVPPKQSTLFAYQKENIQKTSAMIKQNANAYLIKGTTFPYCDQFRVPCLNTKPAYMQAFSPVRRFQKFSEHKSLIKYLHA